MGSNIKIRWAVHKSGNDWFPIIFRPECERTLFDRNTGKDESLLEVMERLDKAGYELRGQPPEKESK